MKCQFFLEMVIFILKWRNLKKMDRNQTKICPGQKFVTNEYPGIHIYIYTYIHVYSHIYIYTFILIYIFICIHIYIYIERERGNKYSQINIFPTTDSIKVMVEAAIVSAPCFPCSADPVDTIGISHGEATWVCSLEARQRGYVQ